MLTPVNGATPLPVAPAVSVPAIAPVTPPSRSESPSSGGRDDAPPRERTPLYDRRGMATGDTRGRTVSRKA